MNDIVPIDQIEKAGKYIAQSKLFGVKTPDEAIALMLIAQSEGRNPFEAARDYHIIQGRPALKADAILARFQKAGGQVEWLEYTDAKVSATFSHSQGGKITIDWTMERAKQAGLTSKDNWRNYPRQMLKARVISEGVRVVYPGACSGIYSVEEVQDMGADIPTPEPEIIIAEKTAADQQTVISKTVDEYKAEAMGLCEDHAITEDRKKELWKTANHDWPSFIAALKAEPEVMF